MSTTVNGTDTILELAKVSAVRAQQDKLMKMDESRQLSTIETNDAKMNVEVSSSIVVDLLGVHNYSLASEALIAMTSATNVLITKNGDSSDGVNLIRDFGFKKIMSSQAFGTGSSVNEEVLTGVFAALESSFLTSPQSPYGVLREMFNGADKKAGTLRVSMGTASVGMVVARLLNFGTATEGNQVAVFNQNRDELNAFLSNPEMDSAEKKAIVLGVKNELITMLRAKSAKSGKPGVEKDAALKKQIDGIEVAFAKNEEVVPVLSNDHMLFEEIVADLRSEAEHKDRGRTKDIADSFGKDKNPNATMGEIMARMPVFIPSIKAKPFTKPWGKASMASSVILMGGSFAGATSEDISSNFITDGINKLSEMFGGKKLIMDDVDKAKVINEVIDPLKSDIAALASKLPTASTSMTYASMWMVTSRYRIPFPSNGNPAVDNNLVSLSENIVDFYNAGLETLNDSKPLSKEEADEWSLNGRVDTLPMPLRMQLNDPQIQDSLLNGALKDKANTSFGRLALSLKNNKENRPSLEKIAASLVEFQNTEALGTSADPVANPQKKLEAGTKLLVDIRNYMRVNAGATIEEIVEQVPGLEDGLLEMASLGNMGEMIDSVVVAGGVDINFATQIKKYVGKERVNESAQTASLIVEVKRWMNNPSKGDNAFSNITADQATALATLVRSKKNNGILDTDAVQSEISNTATGKAYSIVISSKEEKMDMGTAIEHVRQMLDIKKQEVANMEILDPGMAQTKQDAMDDKKAKAADEAKKAKAAGRPLI